MKTEITEFLHQPCSLCNNATGVCHFLNKPHLHCTGSQSQEECGRPICINHTTSCYISKLAFTPLRGAMESCNTSPPVRMYIMHFNSCSEKIHTHSVLWVDKLVKLRRHHTTNNAYNTGVLIISGIINECDSSAKQSILVLRIF